MTAIAASFSAKGKTFDDQLSPILVKELRQGMRARLFVLSFLLLQVFLIVLTLASLAAQGDRFALQTESGFFWTIMGFMLLLLTPLRGLAAISGEVRGRTLETIMLTRLTAWRVVFGKWTALIAQSLLLVSAVLPYVVLRYFIGGDDIVSDFRMLVLFLWLSALLNAASIAVSALGNPIIRIVVFIGIIFFTGSGASRFFMSGMSSTGAWQMIGWMVLDGVFICLLLFQLTASSIAPPAENHAARRRGLAVFFFTLSAALYWAGGRVFVLGIGVAELVLIGVCYYELAERPRLLPRMALAFAQRGTPGKVAGIFLLPGWPSGLLFSLVTIPGAIWIYQACLPSADRDQWGLFILSVLGSILIPVLLCHFIWRKMNQVLLVVILYNLIISGIAGICEGFQMIMRARVDLLLALLPGIPTYIATRNVDTSASYPENFFWHIIGNMVVMLVVIFLLLFESRGYFRQLFALYRSGSK